MITTKQSYWTEKEGWQGLEPFAEASAVFVFGCREVLEKDELLADIKNTFPKAIFIGCSTAGEIQHNTVRDESIAVTAVSFEKTRLVPIGLTIENAEHSHDIGKKLIEQFDTTNLRHIFVLSDGLHVNGSDLVMGMRLQLSEKINITGGLAGDRSAFKKTLVIDANGNPHEKYIAALGFYSEDLNVSYGSFGGWDSFGMERVVTKSKGNVLYELDGVPALELYKSFLGDQAADLPASALLFPLSVKIAEGQPSLTRTILSVEEATQSMTFAGNIPQGSSVRLMKANMDKLIDGAYTAAEACHNNNENTLAILISCIGRKLVLKQMVEEEIESVRNVLGEQTTTTGFYSYGEICPFSLTILSCELHNQTMTITCFSEN